MLSFIFVHSIFGGIPFIIYSFVFFGIFVLAIDFLKAIVDNEIEKQSLFFRPIKTKWLYIFRPDIFTLIIVTTIFFVRFFI
jgi:hypothetical protein